MEEDIVVRKVGDGIGEVGRMCLSCGSGWEKEVLGRE